MILVVKKKTWFYMSCSPVYLFGGVRLPALELKGWACRRWSWRGGLARGRVAGAAMLSMEKKEVQLELFEIYCLWRLKLEKGDLGILGKKVGWEFWGRRRVGNFEEEGGRRKDKKEN
ncbi:unnamed protein product [Cuscuta campestris]|uniref:Uncharacterized protein n=1 Tax=Cuscuta campestris TaxID=132261 RepID=A0A484KN67_9ASTE|nr:unnamed protein product [Cuscuta campestris]